MVDSMRDMEMNDIEEIEPVSLGNVSSVRRVPGGWIYVDSYGSVDGQDISSVFVPDPKNS